MHPTSQQFCDILDEMKEMHLAKSSDYGQDSDPLFNLRRSSNFGVDPWLATLVRLGDKVTRAEAYAKKRTLRNEGFEDTMLDMACYAILVLVLFRESQAGGHAAAASGGGSDDIDVASVPRCRVSRCDD